ncbi:hypothetical protein BWQ96_08741 [Gracilariopsis chorda]|uniref:Uncharacterized protein n=1 Tax=Gracilariopsis chorda TaxID=448386 RepID=A0A2V3IHM5_9FLOR|nr:hypothetical protein BWQ96_08741 [Gracilariopsis chorda]|eukprot:PXF41538.1 hypothetical protein BWQ96_08741 [Gracilariopsis chorda]
MQSAQAFVATPVLFQPRPALPRPTTRVRPARGGRRVKPARLVMQESARAGKEKKKSAPLFARDIKGNFVWNLRSAAPQDIAGISNVIGPGLPDSIVASLVEDSTCCVVCDTSIKGRKESEGYRNVVMGAALVDVAIVLRESNIVKQADFITVAAHPDLPDGDMVRRKLVLGCLKKMKEEGVSEVTSVVAEENESRLQLLKSCLFKEKSRSEGRVNLVCNLGMENPDPEKKLL